MRVVIFGAGKVGNDFYQEIKNKEEVIAFLDNDENKNGNEISGVNICSAEELPKLQYDMIYIACLKNYMDIRCQLDKLGVAADKISLLPVQRYNNKIESLKIIEQLYAFHETDYEKKYEEKWKEIKEKYKKIEIYEFRVEAIGEVLQRVFPILQCTKSDDILQVFIPDVEVEKRICNKYLINWLRKKIYIVNQDEVLFWAYILKMHLDDIDISDYYKFHLRKEFPCYCVDRKDKVFGFTDVEIEKGEVFLRKINLIRPFVCVTARTPAYNVNSTGHDYDYEYRNMDFLDYEMAIQYLKQQDISTIRMGRMESPIKKIDNCIDYAGLYADDFMDIYLSSQCEFFLANSTGSVYMALIFAKPVLIVNSVPISLGFGGSPYTEKDLFMPKKYYSEYSKRYLSLREIIKVESQCLIFGKRYKEMGIRFVDNTPEEIAEVTQEMFQRLRGIWIDTPEDRKNYQKYLEIYDEMVISARNNPDNWLGGPEPTRISATYLRNNLYLLE